MKKFFLKIISLLFHPLLIPTYTMIMLLWSNYPYGYYLHFSTKLLLLQNIFLGTFIFPVIVISILYFRKTITSFSLEKREERFLPYLSCIIFFAMLAVFFQRTNLAPEIKLVPIISLVLIIAIFFINLKFKISAHAAGIASLTGFLICLSIQYRLYLIIPILGAIFASGVVCYARMEMKVHTSKEVYFGYLLGLLLTITIYTIVLWGKVLLF